MPKNDDALYIFKLCFFEMHSLCFMFVFFLNLATCVFFGLDSALRQPQRNQNVGRDSSPHIICHWLDIKRWELPNILISPWWLTAEQVKKTSQNKIKKNHALDTACHHHMWSGSAFSNTCNLNYQLSNPNLYHRLGARLLLTSPWLRKWIQPSQDGSIKVTKEVHLIPGGNKPSG